MGDPRLDSSSWSWIAAAGPALLVAGHAIDASPPRLAVGLLAAVAAVGLSRRRLPAIVGVGAAALVAYLLVASLPLQPVRLIALSLAAVALAAAQPAARRALALASIVAVGLAIALALAVLWRSGWDAEARRLGELASGLAALAAVALGLVLSGDGERTTTLPHRLAVGVVVAAGLFTVAAARPAAIPSWRPLARGLAPPPAVWTGDAAQTLRTLEWLRAIGLRDAAAALAAVALEQNADAKAVRQHCTTPGIAGRLPERWRTRVGIGRLACRAARMSSQEGATFLLESELPESSDAWYWRGMLTRLAADLFAEADDLDGARTAFLEAEALGDTFARRDLVRALIDGDRYVEALDIVDPEDTLARVWLGLPVESAEAWRAWNASLDLDDLQPPRRVGFSDLFVKLEQPPRDQLRGPDRHGRILAVHDDDLQRRAVWMLPSHVHSTASYLPMPPGREIPGELLLEVAVARGIRLRLVADDGEDLIYTCGSHPTHVDRRVVLFPDGACAGNWTTVRIRPADHLQGKLAELEINGEFALARIAGRPAAVE